MYNYLHMYDMYDRFVEYVRIQQHPQATRDAKNVKIVVLMPMRFCYHSFFFSFFFFWGLCIPYLTSYDNISLARLDLWTERKYIKYYHNYIHTGVFIKMQSGSKIY